MLNVAMTGLCKHESLSLETRFPGTTTKARRHGGKKEDSQGGLGGQGGKISPRRHKGQMRDDG
jgi:hypothetical protein